MISETKRRSFISAGNEAQDFFSSLLVEFREGDALKTLSVDLPETIDLLLLDGAKALYPDILDLVETRLRPDAFIVADNADHSPDYLARVRAPESGYLSVPFASDVELSVRGY